MEKLIGTPAQRQRIKRREVGTQVSKTWLGRCLRHIPVRWVEIVFQVGRGTRCVLREKRDLWSCDVKRKNECLTRWKLRLLLRNLTLRTWRVLEGFTQMHIMISSALSKWILGRSGLQGAVGSHSRYPGHRVTSRTRGLQPAQGAAQLCVLAASFLLRMVGFA